MTDTLLPTPSPAKPAGPKPVAHPHTDPLPRDLQRAALRDLVQLSLDCAKAEGEIEAWFAQAKADIETAHGKAMWALDQRAETQRGQIAEKVEHRVTNARQTFDGQLAQLKAHDQVARKKIAVEFDNTERDLKKRLEGAIFAAEQVLEGVQAKVRAAGKKSKDEFEQQTEAVNGLSVQALQLLHTYGQPGVADTPVDASLDAETGTAQEIYDRTLDGAKMLNKRFASMPIPRLFVGVAPFVIGMVLIAGAGAAAHFLMGDGQTIDAKRIAIACVGAAVVVAIGGIVLKLVGNRQVRDAYRPLALAMEKARLAAQRKFDEATEAQRRELEEGMNKRTEEIQTAKTRVAPLRAKAMTIRDDQLARAAQDLAGKVAALEVARDKQLGEADEWNTKHLGDLADRLAQLKAQEVAGYEQKKSDAAAEYQRRRHDLEAKLHAGLTKTQAPVDEHEGARHAPLDWNDPAWPSWTPPKQFASSVRVGELAVDLKKMADGVRGDRELTLQLPPPFTVPAILAFPRQASLLIRTDRQKRADAIRTLQMAMVRLLTSLPAGRVKFTIIDPVSLGQNFAGFMHLADYDETLVGSRIWTDEDQINSRLANLTDHMETVIQKYLRNEFETIDDYNQQAGELAEPYRFLVIADFPVNCNEEACRRLSSIATSGARCGVYTLIACDMRQQLPVPSVIEDLAAHSINIVQQGEALVWRDDVFGQFPLTLDPPPGEDFLTGVLHKVGQGAKESNRVEVPFESIAPKVEDYWTRSTRSEFSVPMGRMGATRLQAMRLGRGVAQHVLLAGKTGSGKSTLLHAIVTNAAMWYSPDEVEFYLVDFKKGVEFKTYASHMLPHARAIAVESDREFGLSVLQRIDAELTRRGELFRKAGVQDLASYRDTPSAEVMPRTLLIIDEFQEFFSEDDKIAQDAALLMDRLVRQGRAFGVHVLLGSQTIGGSSGLSRSTLGQMAVRVALQTSEADSQIILGDNNTAARLLSRPGEAIYNDQGGLVEANSPFQVAWLSDDRKDRYLEHIRKLADDRGVSRPEPVVFEGNAPADIRRNAQLKMLAQTAAATSATAVPLAYVGDPVAIKDPTSVAFRRQAASNLLIIGQQDEQALGVLASTLVSLGAHHAKDGATFYLLDGTPVDSPLAGQLQQVVSYLPQETKLVEYRGVEAAVNELADELARRTEAAEPDPKNLYLVIVGLQRFRALRKTEDEFSFSLSSSDEPKKPNTGKQLADLLRDGPSHGIHVIAWVDTAAGIERTLDRTSLREFDRRVLFQMSSNDSSNLIDSPAANRLGFFRAIAYSEEAGIMEKFRPYAMPPEAWLEELAAALKSRGN
jgi:hypothetical protein